MILIAPNQPGFPDLMELLEAPPCRSPAGSICYPRWRARCGTRTWTYGAIMCDRSTRAGNRSVKKTTSPMSTFVSALGPGSGLRALSLQPFGPLTSVGLKELFLKTTVLLAFASAKRIEHLHAFSVDSDCIRFGPGDCSVTLRPRLEYVPKSLSTPFEMTETVSPSALATKSSPSQSADAQTAICPVRALRFYIDRSSSFRQSI